jgi:N-acetylneuraminic acid mutarotase
LNTIESLDLTTFLFPYTREQYLLEEYKKISETKDEKALKKEFKKVPTAQLVNWNQSLKPMKNARASFSCFQISNKIYVYGGIQGNDQYKPRLVDIDCERYDPILNEWEEITIANAPKLAAFGWTLVNPHTMLILGGTNGSILTNEMYLIDFVKNTAEQKGNNFEDQLAFNTLVHRQSDNSLYCFAGFGSQGQNFRMSLTDPDYKWQTLEKTHSVLVGESDLEIPYKSAVYFP